MAEREEIHTRFTMVFWGLILAFLPFSINGFDIQVYVIGYLLVAVGCGGLSLQSRKFASARMLCFVLVALWLIGFIVSEELTSVYLLARSIASCAMVWQLLGGFIEFASERQRPDLAASANKRRIMYSIIVIGSSLLLLLPDFSDFLKDGPLVLFLVVSYFLVTSIFLLMVMILHLIHRVIVELVS